MSWKIWKTPKERAKEEFRSALSGGVNLNNWKNAFNHFSEAHRLYLQTGDIGAANHSFAYITFCQAMMEQTDPEKWLNSYKAIGALQNIPIQLSGPVSSSKLSNECYLEYLNAKLRVERSPRTILSQLTELQQGYLSFGEEPLAIHRIRQNQVISGRAWANDWAAKIADLKARIIHANNNQVDSLRSSNFNVELGSTISFACGCMYRSVPIGLARISEEDCPFHNPKPELLILKDSKRWVSAGGEVEPDFVQAIHEVVSLDDYINIQTISLQTGLATDKVTEGLKWLSSKGEITTYESLWSSQRAGRNVPTILLRNTPLNKDYSFAFAKRLAFRKLIEALDYWHFQIEVGFDYVFGELSVWHKEPIRIYVCVQQNNSRFIESNFLKDFNASINVTKFKQRLSGIMEWLINPREFKVGHLNSDVLTAFGWHADLVEDARHERLIAAEGELGDEHIAKVLLWLRNSWSHHPNYKFVEYSESAADDYDWFSSNVTGYSGYYNARKKVNSLLEDQYYRLRRYGLARSKNELGPLRCFLVTY
jgi:hypothetical protein